MGKKKLRDSYVKVFNENGYEVEIVSGFEQYKKISMLANEYDKVILVTGNCSHTNYYQLKEEYGNKLVYSHKVGANRVFDKFNSC